MLTIEQMIEMRKAGQSWDRIAETDQVRTAYSVMKAVTAVIGKTKLPRNQKYLELEPERENILRMRENRMTWPQIAEVYGAAPHHIRMVGDPVYFRSQTEVKRSKNWKVAEASGALLNCIPGRPTGKDIKGELPPPDTRGLTARLLGDPLPGRSALDRMRQSA